MANCTATDGCASRNLARYCHPRDVSTSSSVTKLIENGLQLLVKGGFDAEKVTTTRMYEAQLPGVQKLAIESEWPLFTTIYYIPDHGTAQPGQVNSNLVCPARFQADLQQAVVIQPFDQTEAGARSLATGPGGKLLPVTGVTAQGYVDHTFRYRRPAENQSDIEFLHGSGFELPA